MKQLNQKQSGFTLVEIAIVLVIIGLLLGGVLKGQEMIESAKIKNAAADMNGVTAAYTSYIDRFRRMPGDDGPTLAALTGRGGKWATITTFGNNNGVLNIVQGDVFAATGESVPFWQHLKAAGFLNGNPADAGVAALPRNGFNGLMGVGAGVTPPGAGAVAVLSVCLTEVPGKAARALDTQFDNGVGNSGDFLATVGVAGANTAPGVAVAAYNENLIYTVCRRL